MKYDKIKIIFKHIVKFLKWLFWDFTGLHFIWQMIKPPEKNIKKAPTFMLWLIGIYVALFTIATQRYENRIDIIENRANSIFTQLPISEVRKNALSRISRVQNMSCPYKPNILSPLSIFKSLFLNKYKYNEMVNLLKETLENWKHSLDFVDLSEADLSGLNLVSANLEGAILLGTNFQNTRLDKANLKNVMILGANLKNVSFIEANLEGIFLDPVVAAPVSLNNDTNVEDTQIAWYFSTGESHIEIHDKYDKLLGQTSYLDLMIQHLSVTKCLYNAKINRGLRKILEKKYPELFKSPFPSPPSLVEIKTY